MGAGEHDVARSAPAGELTLDEMRVAARGLWADLPPGSVVWLTGDLGSGKTAFVQALSAAAGVDGATSPTYALVHTYATADGPIHHVDCYRLREPGEAVDLDLDALARNARLTCIEWPERAGPFAPRPDLHLEFSHTRDAGRRRVRPLS